DEENVQTVAYELQPGKQPQRRLLRPPEPTDRRRFLSHELTPDGRFYMWCGPRNPEQLRRVELFDVCTGKRLFQRPIDCAPGYSPHPNVSPDGRLLWFGPSQDENFRYDLQTAETIQADSHKAHFISSDSRWSVTYHRLDGDPYRATQVLH